MDRDHVHLLFFFIAKIRPSTFSQVYALLSSIVCQVDLLLMTFTHHHSPQEWGERDKNSMR